MIMTLLRYKETQRLLKTYLIQVGYIALSNIYPQDVEEWNSSQSKVIFPFSYPQYLEFLINVLKKSTQFILTPLIVLSSHSVSIGFLTKAQHKIVFFCFILHLLGLWGSGRRNKIAYLHCIYCKVKTRIQGEECHNPRSRYVSVCKMIRIECSYI